MIAVLLWIYETEECNNNWNIFLEIKNNWFAIQEQEKELSKFD